MLTVMEFRFVPWEVFHLGIPQGAEFLTVLPSVKPGDDIIMHAMYFLCETNNPRETRRFVCVPTGYNLLGMKTKDFLAAFFSKNGETLLLFDSE